MNEVLEATETKDAGMVEEVSVTKDDAGQLIWEAHCLTCGRQLEACPNGSFAEGAARYHVKYHKGHRVVVGCVWS